MASLSDKKILFGQKKLKISEQKIGKRKKENNLTIGIQNLNKLVLDP
jgi:hypothetical protein